MLWVGVYVGFKVCLVNLLCICVCYDNLDIVEDVYGINLRFLLILVEKYYDVDNFVFKFKKRFDKYECLI